MMCGYWKKKGRKGKEGTLKYGVCVLWRLYNNGCVRGDKGSKQGAKVKRFPLDNESKQKELKEGKRKEERKGRNPKV